MRPSSFDNEAAISTMSSIGSPLRLAQDEHVRDLTSEQCNQ
jgi:hypothetical protein